MTLIITIKHTDAIIMSADSRITEEIKSEYRGEITYRTDFYPKQKLYPIGGVGCFAFWGDLTKLLTLVDSKFKSIPNFSGDVTNLKLWVSDLLRNDLAPHKGGYGEIGFHVAGYDTDGKAHIYHLFWGLQADQDPAHAKPDYHENDHSDWFAVYNGVPQYANLLFKFVTDLEREVGMKAWIGDYGLIHGIRFLDYLIRFTTSQNSTVGEQIITNVISPDNRQFIVINTTSSPFPEDKLENYFEKFRLGSEPIDVVTYTNMNK